MKVLLVDDEAVICESVKMDFARMEHPWNYEIYTAQSVTAAEDIYYSEHPEIVITDISMPKGSGLLLISEIRKDNPGCGILVLSAYDNFEYVRNAFVMGADDYILKPISFSELEKHVRGLAVKIQAGAQAGTLAGKRAGALAGKQAGILAEQAASCGRQNADGLAVHTKTVYQMEDVIEYIRRHVSDKLSAADFAKKMAVSYGRFGKLFKSHTGMSFSSYIIWCRMEQAKEYLENPNVKIKQAAAKVGYADDPQHFSRDFMRIVGMPPKEYQRQVSRSG